LGKNRAEIFKKEKLTIRLGLGDRSSHSCVLDEARNVILKQIIPKTQKVNRQAFSRISRCRIKLETRTRSLWVSRQLSQIGHAETIAQPSVRRS